jgi:hypothetical protein
VAPQLPFAADPGTVTGWLVKESAEDTADTLSDEIEAVTQRYAGLPAAGDPEYNGKLREIAEDGLASDDLSCYLTVSRAVGQSPVVSIVLGLARYSAGMGGAAALQGRTIGFLGETIGDQLPTIVVMPNTIGHTMVDCVEIHTWDAPTVAELDATFVGNTPPVVMAATNAATQTTLPRLMFVPKVWAGFFLDRKTPYQAFKTMEALMATLPIQAQRDNALPLIEWTKAVCVREGPGAAERRVSQLEIPWETPDLVDRRLILWATRRLAPYRSQVPVAPIAAGLPVGMVPQFYAAPAASAVRNYTAMEHDKIRGACSLKAAGYAAFPPPIFAEFLTEGRTTEKVQSVLQVRLKPDMDSDYPVSIYVSRDLAKDIKDLCFGYGGDKEYESCHRGISPFAVVPVSATAASERRRAQERLSRVSHMTSADAKELETSPGSCPTTYDALQRVLLTYQTFLKIIFGPFCAHLIEVTAIRKTLSKRVDEYASMAPKDVAGLLWAIFCDARDFFSNPAVGEDLPETQLLPTRLWLETGSLKVPFNAPIERLLGFARERPVAPTQSAGGSTAEMVFGGGGLSRPPPSTNVKGPPWVNPSPNAILIAALKPAVTKDPKVTILDIMYAGQNRIRYRDIRVGTSGACLDMNMIGVCRSEGCSYNHSPQEPINDVKATRIAGQFKKSVLAFAAGP